MTSEPSLSVSVFVPGYPAPQGSKRHVGRGIMVETCERLPEWRADVRVALTNANGQPMLKLGKEAAALDIEFIMPRRKNAPKKKEIPMITRPDLDKLLRAICDAITSAGIWNDDAQCNYETVRKRYARQEETPGAAITISSSSYM